MTMPTITEMFDACRIPAPPEWIEPVEWGVLFKGKSCKGWIKGALKLDKLASQHPIVEIETYSGMSADGTGIWGFIKKKGIE